MYVWIIKGKKDNCHKEASKEKSTEGKRMKEAQKAGVEYTKRKQIQKELIMMMVINWGPVVARMVKKVGH